MFLLQQWLEIRKIMIRSRNTPKIFIHPFNLPYLMCVHLNIIPDLWTVLGKLSSSHMIFQYSFFFLFYYIFLNTYFSIYVYVLPFHYGIWLLIVLVSWHNFLLVVSIALLHKLDPLTYTEDTNICHTFH